MIKNNLQSTGIPKEEFPEFHLIEPGKPFEANGFKVEPFAVSHSIPDAVGFVIESPDGTRMMTMGDFKTAKVPLGQGFDDEKVAAVAAKGIDYLFVDSTSATSPGETIGESEVKRVAGNFKTVAGRPCYFRGDFFIVSSPAYGCFRFGRRSH